MRAVVLFVVLIIFWCLLSGQLDVHHHLYLIASGVVCCLLTTLICVRLKIVDAEMIPFYALLSMLWYIPWLFWQIILSNIHVAKVIWSSDMHIKPRMIKLPLKTKTAFGSMIYANSITLTPGTVTVEIGNGELLVHALTDDTAADLEADGMQDMVLRLEGSAADAGGQS